MVSEQKLYALFRKLDAMPDVEPGPKLDPDDPIEHMQRLVSERVVELLVLLDEPVTPGCYSQHVISR
jgi:hypothetical protein